MTRAWLRDGMTLGALLWLFGYVLSFVFYPFVPVAWLGPAVAPFALAITLWVAFRRVKGTSLRHYVLVGVTWTALAVVLDYFLLVKLLEPADGYYKLDVYLYYVLTFAVPTAAGWWKLRRNAPQPLGDASHRVS